MRNVLLAALPVALLLGGCQDAPATAPAASLPNLASLQGPVVSDGLVNQAALGALRLSIDLITLEYSADFVAERSAAGQGDNFHLSIRPFLRANNLKVTAIGRTAEGDLSVSVRLTHPFAAPADLNGPPTAVKRIDLHVFDVNGILVTDGSDQFFGGTVVTEGDLLLNADGYRDPGVLFDKTSFGIPVSGANLFPYKLFAAGIDTTQPRSSQGNYAPAAGGWQDAALLAPTGFDVFPQGGAATVDYILKAPTAGGSIDFGLVVTAKYQDPRSAGNGRTKRLPTGNIEDLRYIVPEASGDLQRITATVTGDLRDDQSTDIANIAFEILDWDQDATIATTFPNGADLTEVREDSSIAAIDVDVPALRASGSYTGSAAAPVSGQPVLWASSVAVTNEDLFDAPPGGAEVLGLIRVQDSQDLDDGSPTGIKPFILNESSTVPVSGATLSSTRYQIVRIPVADFNSGPINSGPPASTTFTFASSVAAGATFSLDLDSAMPALSTLDPDGLSLFEVDWENDGTWDDSITMTSGDPMADFTHVYATPIVSQEYKLRITDAFMPVPQQLSTEYGPFTVEVTVGGPVTPVVGPPDPVAPTQASNNMSFQYDRFLVPLVSTASGNVYVTMRPGGTAINTLIRSADGGNTWGTPATLTGMSSSNGHSLGVLANGDVVVVGAIGNTSGRPDGLGWIRASNSGTNALTVNPLQTISAPNEWRDATAMAHPSDATKAWIVANHDTTELVEGDDVLTVWAVTSANAVPSFGMVGIIDPVSHTGNLFDPMGTIDSAANLHIVWCNGNTVAAPSNGLWYRGFNTTTNMVTGAEERVSLAGQQQVNIHGHILLDQAGNPVVVYDEGSSTSLANDIYVTKRTGTWSTPTAITGPADVGQQAPYVLRDSAGRFLVSWRDNRHATTPGHIYGRFLEDNLSPNGPEFVIDNSPNNFLHCRVAYSGSGNSAIALWYDSTGTASIPRLVRSMITY